MSDNEVLDRVRRIETALCRHIENKPDKRANNYTAEVWLSPEGYEVDVNSMSISLQEIVSAARAAGVTVEEVTICDNGKPRLIIREVRDMSHN